MFRAIIFFVVLVLCIGVVFKTPMFNNKTNTCTITSKESVIVQNHSQYRVYTKECGTYVVEDSLFIFRFDSADVYGGLVPNTKYEIKSGGYRVPFLSLFPNVISVKPLN